MPGDWGDDTQGQQEWYSLGNQSPQCERRHDGNQRVHVNEVTSTEASSLMLPVRNASEGPIRNDSRLPQLHVSGYSGVSFTSELRQRYQLAMEA